MSAWMLEFCPSTRVGKFVIDSEEDIILLPDLRGRGQGDLSTIDGICQGSIAILSTTGDTYYRLKGDNSWVKITIGGGGGGVTSYNQLTDKPQLNNVTLEGNLSSDDIDVSPESRVDGEQLIFDQNQFGFGI